LNILAFNFHTDKIRKFDLHSIDGNFLFMVAQNGRAEREVGGFPGQITDIEPAFKSQYDPLAALVVGGPLERNVVASPSFNEILKKDRFQL
jgi:hypothetical protein